MKRREFVIVSGSALTTAVLGSACSRPRPPRLQDKIGTLRDHMGTLVTQGQFPGAVWLLALNDDVAADTVGVTAIGGNLPMRRDTIFRIASMTKAVTAAAVMMLVEDGVLHPEGVSVASD